MKRKQLYITEAQQEHITAIASYSERKESEVIRNIIDAGIKYMQKEIIENFGNK